MEVPNQLALEKKWQQVWKDKQIFVPKVDTSKEKFFGTVPYPYANSALHIGHGRMNTAADIFLRFQRLTGHNVMFPMAFHISGTPVLAVADGIKRKDPKQVELTRSAISEYIDDKKEVERILNSFEDPMKIADFFSSKIEETFDSVGLGVDWSKTFSTGDEGYKKFVSWQYKKLEEAGILVQGKYPILYSAVDENAVGEDDIKDGDVEKVTVQEMHYLLFKDKETNEYVAIATLRPDALFGATNLWVDPEMDLVKVQVENKTWIVAKAALVKLEHQYDDVKVLSELKGKELLDKTYIAPLLDREVPVLKATFIDENHGTGMVYSSPGGSPHDLLALKLSGKDIPVINTVISKDKKGNVIAYSGTCPADDKLNKFKITSLDDPKLEDAKQELYKEEHYGGTLNDACGRWSGLSIKKAKDAVAKALQEKKLGGIFYETSRRAQTRAGNQVIVANLHGQWFLDYSADDVKKKAYEVLDGMSFFPEKLRNTQRGYLEWVQKRPCARKRGIGTPLPQDPQWVVEPLSDSTIYQMYYVIAQYVNDGTISVDDLTPEFFNYVYFDEGDLTQYKEIQEAVHYWKSFDLRLTAATHMSNHLSFLIYHYGLLFPKELHPKNITIGGLLIRDGNKISKSKGNGLPLIQIRETYGADLYRLYIAVGTSYDSEFDFRDDDIFQLRKKFELWKELMFAAKQLDKKSYEDFDDVDKWLISSFYSKIDGYFELMDEVKFREAYVSVLYEFLNELNYHSRRTSKEQTLAVLRFIFDDYVKLMTPVTPHVCEELFGDEVVSLASYSFEGKEYVDKKIEDVENITRDLISTIAMFKDRKGIQHLSKVKIVQAAPLKFELFDVLAPLLAKTREFKKILPALLEKFPQEKPFITKFVPKTLGSGLQHYLPRDDERVYLESVVEFIKNEFNCEVELVDEESSAALPGKPAVLVE